MEQTKGRRAFCIGLSILIALLVWFYANDDTEIEISVNDVPIEFTNEDTSLADKGLMLLSYEEEAIDLKLSMPRSTYFKLDPDKIRIVVDLSRSQRPAHRRSPTASFIRAGRAASCFRAASRRKSRPSARPPLRSASCSARMWRSAAR